MGKDKKGKSVPNKQSTEKNEVDEAAKAAAKQRAAAGRAAVSSSSSWTGKLPGSLLQEHCQKQKWEKVTFDCKHVKDGFVITAVLGQKNQKTNEIEYVRFTPPKELVQPQSTPIEARHLAATYALHRVASHKNMKMVLPGAHKELWSKLDDAKKQCADKDRFYAADPFLAEREFQAKKKKQQEVNTPAKENAIRISKVVKNVKSEIKSENSSGDKVDNSVVPQKRVHFKEAIGMEKDVRMKVEKVIREHDGFELLNKNKEGKQSKSKPNVVKTLSDLGFESFQVNEALEYTSTISDALEWLLIYLPEADLPSIFKKSESIGAMATVQTRDFKSELAVRELKLFGYDEEMVEDAVSRFGKVDALAALTQQLVTGKVAEEYVTTGDSSIWTEEVESLGVLYDECKIDENGEKISIKLDNNVTVHLWKSKGYPDAFPGIGLEPHGKVAKYALLDVIRLAGEEAMNHLGGYLLSVIIEWIKENYDQVLKNPSKLMKISSTTVHGLSSSSNNSSELKKVKINRLGYPKVNARELKLEKENIEKDGKMLKQRQQLPAWNKRQQAIDIINKNQVTLITGETGSGKSTQVAQFIMDCLIDQEKGDKCNIICTQPRRISAMGLAQRVAAERVSDVGKFVGYSIRGESKVCEKTMLRFVTAGVLLRMLQTDAQALKNVSHVIVDEVHERSLDAAFLLILLRRLIKSNKEIKVVLMSATVDVEAFSSYFDNNIGRMHIEGRTFPVDNVYLDQIIQSTGYIPYSLQGVVEDVTSQIGRIIIALKDQLDYNLISRIIEHAHKTLEDGSVIIFMSGTAEIDTCIRNIQSSKDFYVLPLHASLPPQEQRRVFDSPPPGKRKIVVSTNVAETSITIPDAVGVIDTGRVKQTVFDPEAKVVKLVDSYASQAEVTQRRGRAGRVRRGVCYKLYTETLENGFPAQPTPEIQRTSLEQLYLSVSAMNVGEPEGFLQEALDKPDVKTLQNAKDILIQTGTLDKDGKLTSLGKHASLLPTDVRTAKLLILSAAFGVLEWGLTIASILTHKSPFISPREKRDESKEAMKGFDISHGDLIAACLAFNEWSDLKNKGKKNNKQLRQWCDANFLSSQVLFDLVSSRRQFKESLQEIGFLSYSSKVEQYNNNAESMRLVDAVVGAALTPNLADIVLPKKQFKAASGGAVELDHDAKDVKFFTTDGRIFIHPGSLLFGCTKYNGQYLSYGSKMTTSKTFMSQLTPVGKYGMLFFSDNVTVDPLGNGVIARQWLGLKCWPRVGILVKALRALFNDMLDAKFDNPAMDFDNEIVNTVILLIESEGRNV